MFCDTKGLNILSVLNKKHPFKDYKIHAMGFQEDMKYRKHWIKGRVC